MKQQRSIQKKELVFRILDEMKKSGEKVNADNVAKRAQMGKQTILPYYNEWRFFDDPKQQQESELPDDLIRSLRSLITQWKNDVSKKLEERQSTAEQEAEQLKKRIEQLTIEKDNTNNLLSQAQKANDQLTQELKDSNQQALQTNLQLQKSQIEASKQKTENINLKKESEEASCKYTVMLESQEVKLDQQYKVQIDHWMKAIDEERLQKQAINKTLESLKQDLLICEKEKIRFKNQMEHKTQAYKEASIELDDLRSALKSRDPSLIILSKLELLLEAEQGEILNETKTLLTLRHSYAQCVNDLKAKEALAKELQDCLNRESAKEKSLQQAKLELEKSKGYSLALEKVLQTTQGKEP
ncbi:MAG: DNA-binding protein [Candidatus Endonucleobacter sp. (ex Gigantidas childressi)]|nr:DNA-binding protein [Candidatus Endonucleobacter sp. (ex Gigantidas childressi)]